MTELELLGPRAHGEACGQAVLKATAEDFQVLAGHGGSMVWSPLSNLLLYGQTADIAAARRVSSGSGRSSAPRQRAKSGDAERLAAIRSWAQGAGYAVGDRGRIKAEIVDAYDAAH